jgi:opacity protein-like surface antigen
MTIHKIARKLSAAVLVALAGASAFAGNPDRRGQNGATELLLNPWARSSGINSLNTASIRGLEAERINVAGLAFVSSTDICFSRTNYLSGSGIAINSFGLATKLGGEGSSKGVLGISIMNFDFGNVEITNENFPDGGVGTYRPQFMNIGISYAKVFSNRIYGGMTVRIINQSVPDASASGIALDAGIQYQTGERDRAKFGISLRNIGTPMSYSGDALAYRALVANGKYDQTLYQRSAKFELPSLMNIGGSYDLITNDQQKLTLVANFTSNSFTSDNYGAGLEYNWHNMVSLRAGYRHSDVNEIHTGLAGGVSLNLPMQKDEDGNVTRNFGIDYAYRPSNPFQGTHTLGILLKL